MPRKDATSSRSEDSTNSQPISGVVGLVASRPKVDWEIAARMFLEKGLNCGEIAARLGYSANYVRRQLKKLGVTRRSIHLENDPRELSLRRVWRKIHADCKSTIVTSTGRRFTPRICAEWSHYPAFRKWAIAFGFEKGMCVRRLDSEMDFGPDTCQVVSLSERLGTHEIVAFGETKSLTAWSLDPRCQVKRGGLAKRLAQGLPPEEAITMPLKPSDERIRSKRAAARSENQVDWHVARKRYEVDGLTASTIARELGVHAEMILDGLRSRGVTIRPGRGNPVTRESHTLRSTWKRMCSVSRKFFAGRDVGGIAGVDPRWRAFEDFEGWARNSGWELGRCLSRIDLSKTFSPENCRWVTRAELPGSRPISHKPRKAFVLITAFGETKGITDWTRDPRCSVCIATLRRRLLDGFQPEDAISKKRESPFRNGPNARFLEAFGERRINVDWIADARCRVAMTTLRARLRSGWKAEDAISTPPFGKPQGSSD